MEQSNGKFRLGSMRIFMGLLLFALPYGLWTMRFEPEATAPMLVGSMVNLLWVSLLANALVAFNKKRIDQVKSAAASSTTS